MVNKQSLCPWEPMVRDKAQLFAEQALITIPVLSRRWVSAGGETRAALEAQHEDRVLSCDTLAAGPIKAQHVGRGDDGGELRHLARHQLHHEETHHQSVPHDSHPALLEHLAEVSCTIPSSSGSLVTKKSPPWHAGAWVMQVAFPTQGPKGMCFLGIGTTGNKLAFRPKKMFKLACDLVHNVASWLRYCFF